MYLNAKLNENKNFEMLNKKNFLNSILIQKKFRKICFQTQIKNENKIIIADSVHNFNPFSILKENFKEMKY